MVHHIFPIDDEKPHEGSARCECKPDVEIYMGEVYILHNYFAETAFYERLLGNICAN